MINAASTTEGGGVQTFNCKRSPPETSKVLILSNNAKLSYVTRFAAMYLYKSTVCRRMDIDHDSNCTCTSSSSFCTWPREILTAQTRNGARQRFAECVALSLRTWETNRTTTRRRSIFRRRFFSPPRREPTANPPLSLEFGLQSSYFLFHARGPRAINYAAVDRQPWAANPPPAPYLDNSAPDYKAPLLYLCLASWTVD